jgi:hypothetical protein
LRLRKQMAKLSLNILADMAWMELPNDAFCVIGFAVFRCLKHR